MGLLTKDQVRASNDLKTKDVDVPAWGGTVRIRELTTPERLEWLKYGRDADSAESEDVIDRAYVGLRVTAKLVVMSVIDASGENEYDDSDIEWLINKSPDALNDVADECLELSKLGEREKEEGKDGSAGAETSSSSTASAASGESSPGKPNGGD